VCKSKEEAAQYAVGKAYEIVKDESNTTQAFKLSGLLEINLLQSTADAAQVMRYSFPKRLLDNVQP